MLEVIISASSDLITTRWCLEHVKSILHFLLYHRLQIPVPYPTLKILIDQIKNDSRESKNFFLERHRTLATETYDRVQTIADLLEKLIVIQGRSFQCAAVAFGPTTTVLKELYFIKLPRTGHINEAHTGSVLRRVAQTMISLVTDTRLSPFLNAPLPLTNVHLLLKLSDEDDPIDLSSMEEFGEELKAFQVPRSCKTLLIDLERNNRPTEIIPCVTTEEQIEIYADPECGLELKCSQMTISEETIECENESMNSVEDLFSGRWFQLTTVLKGFKDVLSNGQKIWAR